MKTRALLVVLAIALPTANIAACGGSSSDTTVQPAGGSGGQDGGADVSSGGTGAKGGTAGSAGKGGAGQGGSSANGGSGGKGGTAGSSGSSGSSGAGGTAGTGGAPIDAGAEPAKGISAWLYANKQSFADQLAAYDTAVQTKSDGASRRLKYLFPWAGTVRITGTTYDPQHVTLDLSTTATAFYASRLPGVVMLANVDSFDGAMLSSWSPADQQKLAVQIAQHVLDDPNAQGVHVDIEPYDDRQVPFYKELRAKLNSNGRIVTIFTSKMSGPIYENVDVVVLSGYDVGATAPSNYARVLECMIRPALQSAQNAGSYLMVGIPASASWEEYAYRTSDGGTCDKDTGFTQEEWLDAALKAVCPHHYDSHYLGVSLWEVTDIALRTGTSAPYCYRHPDKISDAAYAMIEAFDPNHCPPFEPIDGGDCWSWLGP
jgi:hypothetical protein